MNWTKTADKINIFKEAIRVSKTDTITEDMKQVIAELDADIEDIQKTEEACICTSGKPYMPKWLVKTTGIAIIYFTLYYVDVVLGGILLGW